MKGILGIFGLAVLLSDGAASAASGQMHPSQTRRTIWDGVYTEAQAARGQVAARESCLSCHSPTAWADGGVLTRWVGRPITELHEHVRASMPLGRPGRLSREQYADIVAYMLKLNAAPSGTTELPSDVEELRRITVTPRASSR